MKRELIYNGKTLSQMTLEELRNQLQFNHKRSIIRALFFLIVAVASIFVYPILPIVPVIFLVITQYWMMQNNVRIKQEIESRNKN